MGIELARCYITVEADATQVAPSLQQVQAQTSSMLKDIAAGMAGILAPISGGLGHIFEEGLKGAGEMEQTRVDLETFIGSAKETEQTIKRLTKFAAETPFEMPQLMTVTKGLVLFGKRGDELMETLKMMGDASGGTAQKFNTLAMVYEHVMGTGHLTTIMFRELANRGIINLKDLSKYYGKTDEEAEKMLSHGKVKFQDFHNILKKNTEEGGRFHDAMKKQSQTFEGLKSTLKDAIHITERLLMEPLLPWIEKLMNGVIALLNPLGDLVKDGGEAVSFAFVGATAFAALGLAISGCTFAMKLFGVSIRGALIGSGIGIFLVALGALVGYLVSAFNALEGAIQFFEWLNDKINETNGLADKLLMAWERVVDTFEILGAAIVTVFESFLTEGQKASDFWQQFKEDAEGAFEEILSATGEFVLNTSEWIQAYAANWRTLWEGMPLVAGGVLSYIFDIGENAARQFYDVMVNILGKLIEWFYELAGQLKYIIMKVFQAIGIAKGAAMGGEDPMEALENMRKEAQEINKAMGVGHEQPLGEMSEDTKRLFKFGGLDNFLQQAKETKERLQQNRWLPEPKKEEEEDFSKPKPPEAKKPNFLKAGSTGIEQFGKKIQDEFLKKEEDTGKQTVDILKESKKTQDKLLDETKTQGKKLGMAK